MKKKKIEKAVMQEEMSKSQEVSRFALINPAYLKKQINHLGVEAFHPLKYARFILLGVIALLGMCFLLKLKTICTVILLILELLLLPGLYYIGIRNQYEQRRFMDVSAYLEQLLYSFKRRPKILSALKDTAILFDDGKGGRLRGAIDNAVNHIQYGETSGDIYQEAFGYIEEEYGCKRVYKAHGFLTRVENAGGDPGEPIDILLNDRNLWVSRIQSLLHDKNKIRINVGIGIALSLLIVVMTVYMLPAEFGIYLSPISQVAKTVTLGLDMLIWYFVQVALGKSLLDADKDLPFEEVERSYNIVMHGQNKTKSRNAVIAAGLCVVGGIIAFFTLGTAVAILVFLFAALMLTQPKRQYKACFKRVKREVEKAFPDWLLSLALQMQTDNLHVSIVKTTLDAPRIMSEELQKLQNGIETKPDDLAPYVEFFKVLEIADIVTAMKMLYAMDQFGAADSQEQIKALVDRNTEIMDKAERMRLEDHLAGISFAMLLPMLTGVLSMLADLVLVMGFVLSQVNI